VRRGGKSFPALYAACMGQKPTTSFRFFWAVAYSLLLLVRDGVCIKHSLNGTILPEKDRNDALRLILFLFP
jgi:hypothetical protein